MNPRESTLLVLLFVAAVSTPEVSAFVLGSGALSAGHNRPYASKAATAVQALSSSEANSLVGIGDRRVLSGPRSSRGKVSCDCIDHALPLCSLVKFELVGRLWIKAMRSKRHIPTQQASRSQAAAQRS